MRPYRGHKGCWHSRGLHASASAAVVAESCRSGAYCSGKSWRNNASDNICIGIHSLHFGYYRLLAKRFPYLIYYRTAEEEVVVYRVPDCRSDPVCI